MKRRVMWAAVAVLLAAATFGLHAAVGTLTVTLTEDDVQRRLNSQLDKEFPVKGAARLLVTSVRAESATVHIADGHVDVVVDVAGTLRAGKTFTLTAHATGVPVYEDGAFYFTPEQVEVQKFAYEGATPTELVSRLAQRLGAREALRKRIEDNAGRAEEWMSGTAENAAMHALERRPVYRPKDDIKGMLIRTALQSMAVEQDHVVLVFTLWRVTLAVVLGALALVLAVMLAVVLIRQPAPAAPAEPAAPPKPGVKT